jgi:hypothetical protein
MVGMLAVDVLLLSPISDLARYCGLSGLLNTLMGVALYLLWSSSRSPIIAITGTLYLLKIALEMHAGQSIFTQTSWPPYAAAHLAGLLGAPIALALGKAQGLCDTPPGLRETTTKTQRKVYGHMVSSQ